MDASSISSTLLERVRARRPEAWQRLVELYGPVVYRWCRQSNLQPEDAADVVQEVFRAVLEHVDQFRRELPEDSFVAWMGTITRNKLRDRFRRREHLPDARGGTTAQRRMAELYQPNEPSAESFEPDPPSQAWISRCGMDLVRAEFENRTWEAFWLAAVEGRPPIDIAADLGMTVEAVYKAKSRVLRRLRQELGGLM